MKYCPICTTDFPASESRCPHDGARLVEKDQWAPGTVIRNKYRILGCIGRGGMGTVYKAEHLVFKDTWAIKVMNPRLSSEPEFVRRFYFEAEKQRKLKHRNVVRVDDVDESEDGKLFIGMEYVDGLPLREMMQAAQGPLAIPLAISIIRGVAEALEAADTLGIIHRDIKPDNVLMERGGGAFIPKLTDFGVAKLREGTATLSKAPMLTPQYAAPEQWQPEADKPLTGRTDLYALGVMLFELVTGRLPFDGSNDREWMYAHLNQIPPPASRYNPAVAEVPGLDEIIAALLAKDSDDRPADAGVLLRELTLLDLPATRVRAGTGAGIEPTRRISTPMPSTVRRSSTPFPAAKPTTDAVGARRVPGRYREENVAVAAEAPATEPVASSHRLAWIIAGCALLALAGGGYLAWPHLAASMSGGAPAPAASAETAPITAGTTPPVAHAAVHNPPPAKTPPVHPDTPPAPGPTAAAGTVEAPAAPTPALPPTEAYSRPLTGHTDAISTLAFSPRGLRLASGGDDQNIKIWDLAAGGNTSRTLSADAYVHAVSFSSDGRQLAVGDSSNRVVVWDAVNDKQLHVLNGHHDQVESVAFNPVNSRMLASGGDDKAIRIWNVADQTASPTLSGAAGVETVAFSADGRMLAAGEDDHTVVVWEVASWNVLTPPNFEGPGIVRAVAFDPKGRWLAAGGGDATIRVWDVGTWSPATPVLRGHRSLVTALAFSPDGRWLASGSGDSTVRIWDTSNWNSYTTLAGPGSGVRAIAFSPDGRILAAAGGDHTVKLWHRPGSQP